MFYRNGLIKGRLGIILGICLQRCIKLFFGKIPIGNQYQWEILLRLVNRKFLINLKLQEILCIPIKIGIH